MHIRGDQEDQELVKRVKATLLDGKIVPMVFEANEEEGWVKSYIPSLPENVKQISADSEITIEEDKNLEQAGFLLVKRSGKVRIVLHPET
jgi:hypothetical protein